MNSLGTLIKTLDEKCLECNKPLQLRIRKREQFIDGAVTEVGDKYKYCHICGTETPMGHNKRDWRVKNASIKKHDRNPKRDGGKGGRSAKRSVR